jgi:hypothetical protein
MHSKTTEFILSTIFDIYPRKIIELIEDNNLNIKYDKNIKLYDLVVEIEEKLQISFDNEIQEYYKYILTNNYDIDIFCKRCGIFGHSDTCNKCIFYNEKYYKINSRKQILSIINEIKDKSIEKYEKEQKEIERHKKLCKICKYNIFSPNCINLNCKSCCKNKNCIKHKNCKLL